MTDPTRGLGWLLGGITVAVALVALAAASVDTATAVSGVAYVVAWGWVAVLVAALALAVAVVVWPELAAHARTRRAVAVVVHCCTVVCYGGLALVGLVGLVTSLLP